jgi:UDP-N-acetylmuramate--alanine ligase
MLNSVDFSGKPFHFIGVGGIGMSALAYVLAKRELPVSGSDLRLSHITQRLQEEGVHIFWSQDSSNLQLFSSSANSPEKKGDLQRKVASGSTASVAQQIDCLPQVICSTAIHADNAEFQAAQSLGCPIFHRSDVLAALIQEYDSIAIAGTHGKTTTSSLVGYMLMQAGLDPTIVVGGEVNAWGGNAHVGKGSNLVAEADESDGSLVKFAPSIGVITNIELDHPDHYQTLEQVVDIFKTFADRSQTLIGCSDCPVVREQLSPTITYSLNDPNATYTVDCINYRADGTTARVWENGVILGQLNLALLGAHNLSNALAAVAVGRLLKVDFVTIAQALVSFEGARRRFERRGEFNGILFLDDYAHHPSEILATLASARLRVQSTRSSTPGRRVVAVFQPHRYSRTLKFLSEFAAAFSDADVVVVSDIYSAGEENLGDISGQQVADLIAEHHPQVFYQPTFPGISQLLENLLLPGDIALFLGAGNLNQLIPEVMAFHQSIEQGLVQEWCNHA